MVDRPHEALHLFEEWTEEIAVVLSDVQMPGMSGPQLVRKILERAPATAVVLMSGHTGEEVLDPQIPFLSKPFQLRFLRETVEGLLGRGKNRQ